MLSWGEWVGGWGGGWMGGGGVGYPKNHDIKGTAAYGHLLLAPSVPPLLLQSPNFRIIQ